MDARSRGHASPLAPNGQSPSSGSQSPVVPPGTTTSGSSSPSTPQPPLLAPQQSPANPAASPDPSPVPHLPVLLAEAQLPPPAAPGAAPPQKRSIISRLFGMSAAPEASPPPPGKCSEIGRSSPLLFSSSHLRRNGRQQNIHKQGGYLEASGKNLVLLAGMRGEAKTMVLIAVGLGWVGWERGLSESGPKTSGAKGPGERGL